MIRLFLPPEQLVSKEIIIADEQARYLSLVMRVQPGDPVIIFDGQGNKYTCKVLSSRKKETLVYQVKRDPYSAESPVAITLAQGIPKGSKMDFIIQKSTELGIKRIVPILTERSEIKRTSKVDRWRKIALSASQQSGREKIPDVSIPVHYHDFLNKHTIRHSIILSEDEKELSLKKVLKNILGAAELVILVGPEGGFSKDEVSAAVEKGFISISLGPRILRTETAPITALSILQYELGGLG